MLEDLQALHAEVQDEFCQFEAKDRSCPDLGPIKIGQFGRFPEFDRSVCPAMFSVDLIKSARNTLRFLSAIDGLDRETLDNTCRIRYPAFLSLQASTKDRLLPPLDVAIVWFSHMLQVRKKVPPCCFSNLLFFLKSGEYNQFAKSFGLDLLSHCSQWCFDEKDDPVKLVALSRGAWDKSCKECGVFGDEWISLLQSPPSESVENFLSASQPVVCGVHAKDVRVQLSGFVFK